MAVHDPDERVRATALQYVARLAGPKDEDANELLAEVLARGAPLLQLGCIAGLRADAPPALWGAAAACVTSADRDLRWAAYEAVMRHGAFAQPGPELAREFLNREPERPTRVERLAAAPRARRQRSAADRCIERRARWTRASCQRWSTRSRSTRVRLEWGEVEKLIARFPNDTVNERVLQLLAVGTRGRRAPALLRLFVARACSADGRGGRDGSRGRADEQVLVRSARPRWTRIAGRSTKRSAAAPGAGGARRAGRRTQARSDPNFFENVDPDLVPEIPDGPDQIRCPSPGSARRSGRSWRDSRRSRSTEPGDEA